VHYGAETAGLHRGAGLRHDRRQVQLINDFKPDIITVTLSYMLAISDESGARSDPR
jgi:phenylacetate-CoA ligase